MVFARFARIAMVAVLVATMGGHWVLLQTVARTAKLADTLNHGSVCEAVSRTFDGKHPCPLCKAIAAGKKSEQKKPGSFTMQKLEFIPAQGAAELIVLFRFPKFVRGNVAAQSAFQKPLLPPPRGLLA
jgi:hypothetical protein